MAEILENDVSQAALKARIDAKIEKARKLENEDVRNLINERDQLLMNSAPLNKMEISLTNELKLLRNTGKSLRNEIEAARKSVDDKRDEVARTKSAKDDSHAERVNELELFEKGIADVVPKFRAALTLYSDVNLRKEIRRIRSEGKNFADEIARVERDIEALVSKYNLERIEGFSIPGNESAISELQELKAAWVNLNSEKILARKEGESSNQELEKKVNRKNREIANLTD